MGGGAMPTPSISKPRNVWVEDLARMYRYGRRNARELEEKGCLVLYKVDALKMSQDLVLNTQRFDRIVYNFPHAGFLYSEDDNHQIKHLKC